MSDECGCVGGNRRLGRVQPFPAEEIERSSGRDRGRDRHAVRGEQNARVGRRGVYTMIRSGTGRCRTGTRLRWWCRRLCPSDVASARPDDPGPPRAAAPRACSRTLPVPETWSGGLDERHDRAPPFRPPVPPRGERAEAPGLSRVLAFQVGVAAVVGLHHAGEVLIPIAAPARCGRRWTRAWSGHGATRAPAPSRGHRPASGRRRRPGRGNHPRPVVPMRSPAGCSASRRGVALAPPLSSRSPFVCPDRGRDRDGSGREGQVVPELADRISCGVRRILGSPVSSRFSESAAATSHNCVLSSGTISRVDTLVIFSGW